MTTTTTSTSGVSSDLFNLYYSKTSCSAASFIVAHAAGLNFEPMETDITKHKIVNRDQDFYAINPKGNVPTLVLPNGQQLNENISVLLFLGDQANKMGKNHLTNLTPPEGSLDRYLFINLLSFLATEVHKACYFRLFGEGTLSRSILKSALISKLKLLDEQLQQNRFNFIFSNNFTVADAYLYQMLTWNSHFDVSLKDNNLNALDAYFQRCEMLPFVKDAQSRMRQLHDMGNNKEIGDSERK